MPVIEIGEGDHKKRVQVSDEFTKKTPVEKQAIVNDIAKQMGMAPAVEQDADAHSDPNKRWRRTMLPIDMEDQVNTKTGKYERTGEWRINVGGFVNDLVHGVTGLVTEPIEAIQQAQRGELDLTSEEGIDKMMPTLMAITGLPMLGKKPKPLPGAVTAETEELVTGTKISGKATAKNEPFVPIEPPKKKMPDPVAPEGGTKKIPLTVTDAEIDALFAQADYNATRPKPVVKPVEAPVGAPPPEAPIPSVVPYKGFQRQISGEQVTAPLYRNITGEGRPIPRVRQPDMRGKDVLAAKGMQITDAGKLDWRGEAWGIFEQLADVDKVAMKEKQAERILATAKEVSKKAYEKMTAAEKAAFLKEVDRRRVMSGKTYPMTSELSKTLEGSVNAVSALDDVVKAKQFVDKLEMTLYAGGRVGGRRRMTRLGSAADMSFELFMNGLLSGPPTQTINALSNVLVKGWEHAENVLAVGIGKVTPGAGMTGREAWARIVGDMESVGDALRAGKKTFVDEIPLFEDVDSAQWLESRRVHQAIPGRAGRIVRIPGRALAATDSFFKLMAYRQTISGLAMREALQPGLSPAQIANRFARLKANPTQVMMDEARFEARRQTFNLRLESKLGRDIQSAIRNTPAKLIVPFYQTPVNLLKYSFERVPGVNLAVAGRKFRNDFLGKNGSYARNQAHARTVMGASVMGYVFHEALKGNVTGFGPTDPAERSLWRAQGNQPYSVRVGDTYYSYSRLEPLGTLLGIAADAASIWEHVGDEEANKIASLLAASISQNVSNKTWLRGPMEFAEAVNDPERYGYSWVKRQAGSLIPTGLAQYARVQDPYLREVNTIMDAFKERIPGLKETLKVQRGVFGEPLKSEGGLGPDLITPLYQTAAKHDATAAEMYRLKVFPGRLQKKIGGTELKAEEWDYYTGVTGLTIKKFADAVVRAPGYKNLNDAWREKLLTDLVRKAGDIGRLATKVKFPDLQMRIEKNKAVERLRLAQPSAGGLPQPTEVPLVDPSTQPPPTPPPTIPVIPGQT